ncbi:pentatricopeptide repeat-containing protein At3g22470, mitochondrial-like [Gossypium raimondii]|uniref:pentatricopeptide repeat-containing protein At3g22470, mitochondrial-like n=1 Tax=Gossypium raimondii TaxID=29730 RepID=UPI00227A75E4|nr:pentatricopeptide repeat-containing protein At3g22470, mitochondrial-like [Gossypium raimondii]
MGKLYSSLIFRSIVNGGSNLSNFHSSSSNSVATHINALSKNSMPARGKPKKYDSLDNVDDALFLFNKMIHKYPMPSVVEFTKLLGAIVSNGTLCRCCFYVTMIDAHCKEGMISEAVEIVDTMRKHGMEPNTGIACKTKWVKLKEYSVEKGCALDIRSHNIIINGYCKAKRMDKAMELFDEITQDGPIPDTVTYNTLMQSMCQLGRVSTAFELLVKMCASG